MESASVTEPFSVYGVKDCGQYYRLYYLSTDPSLPQPPDARKLGFCAEFRLPPDRNRTEDDASKAFAALLNAPLASHHAQ